MPRVIHLYLPEFPLQRWALERAPSTDSLAMPVAMIAESKGLRRVAFASAQARQEGICRGMTATAASARVPELTKLELKPVEDQAALLSLAESLMGVCPVFQLDPPEGIWLSTEAAHLLGELDGGEDALLEAVLKIARRHGYQGRAAVVGGPRVARLLSHSLSRTTRTLRVREGEERGVLHDISISMLEDFGDLAQRCRQLGLKQLGQLAQLSRSSVQARFGALGLEAHRLVCGEDDALLVPTPLAEKLEASLRFDWAAESSEPVLFALKTLFDRLCGRLQGRGQAAVQLTVELELDPRGAHPLRISLARPTSQTRLLLELARLQLEGVSLAQPVSGLHVVVDKACESPALQLELPDGHVTSQGDASLEAILSRLASTLGSAALGALNVPETHLPEAASRLTDFRPPRSSQTGRETSPPFNRERPVRLLVSPERVEVRLGQAKQLLAVRLGGQVRPVQAMAGPEKLRGDWWSETSYGRDYYRVLCEGVGPIWLFEDLRERRYYLHGYFD